MAKRKGSHYEDIRAGLEQVVAHLQGKPTPGMRVTLVEVPRIDVRAVRAKLRLSQQNMATFLSISPSGYRKWEQGKGMPSGPVLTLLEIADREPEAVLRALSAPRGRIVHRAVLA